MAFADQLRLMVLTDPVLLRARDAVDVCRRAVAGGATIVQVRWKDATPSELLQLARALVLALPVPVLVNDRVDVALAAGAAGAHLGQDDPPLDALRPAVPPGILLGNSVGGPRTTGASGPASSRRTRAMRARHSGPTGSRRSRASRPRGCR